MGDTAAVKRCIERAVRIKQLAGELGQTCGRGRTALHHAALCGQQAVVSLLLYAGVSRAACKMGLDASMPMHNCLLF
jgi:hypothetical protein